MLQVFDLRVEYLTNPMGIDVTYPRFSWKLKSDEFCENILNNGFH